MASAIIFAVYADGIRLPLQMRYIVLGSWPMRAATSSP